MTEEQHEAIREEVIGSIERSAEVYGLSRSAGRVYGVLFLAEEPLSIPELVERTGYAKSTISNVTRKLTRIGMTKRRSSEGGGRRVRFTPETDLWFIVQDVFRQYVQREMEMSQRALDRVLDGLDEVDGASTVEQQRIIELRETYGQFQTLLELMMDHSPEELIAAIEEFDGGT